MKIEIEDIIKAFPSEVRTSALSLLSNLNVTKLCKTSFEKTISLQAETLQFPYRVYYNNVGQVNMTKIDEVMHFLKYPRPLNETEILNCVFSRHYNGYIRQIAIQNLISSKQYWVAPYLVRIMGEYVIQILYDLNNEFDCINEENLIAFIRENSGFYKRTQSRVGSYWDVYYRNKFRKQEYVGFQLLAKIDNLLKN